MCPGRARLATFIFQARSPDLRMAEFMEMACSMGEIKLLAHQLRRFTWIFEERMLENVDDPRSYSKGFALPPTLIIHGNTLVIPPNVSVFCRAIWAQPSSRYLLTFCSHFPWANQL